MHPSCNDNMNLPQLFITLFSTTSYGRQKLNGAAEIGYFASDDIHILSLRGLIWFWNERVEWAHHAHSTRFHDCWHWLERPINQVERHKMFRKYVLQMYDFDD